MAQPPQEEWSNIKVLFHNYFSLIGEQPEQRLLAYKQKNQLPVLQQYFTNIAAI